jgi:AAA domain, putative AbiEii toxin, Type IV TA system
MIEQLRLKNVGPAPEIEMKLAPRLNLITGDNGLGKSFLLDVTWWALTRKWPHDLNPSLTSGYPARPTDPKRPSTIAFTLKSKVKSVTYESHYVPRDEAWLGKAGRPWNPGLVIYAHADGGFSVWDPARNYWKKRGNVDVQERLPGFVLAPKDVWNGLRVDIDGKSTVVCNGLLADWASWIRERGEYSERMREILHRLAPQDEPIEVGPLTRLSINDARDIPSIRTAYSKEVPILHASSGIRRAVGLAYMLMWSWNEHARAAKQLGESVTAQVVMLFDEVESHLHPRWQRSILRSLLHIAESLHKKATIQLVAATHSPLILASAEPFFEAGRDAWFDLDLDRSAKTPTVRLEQRPFVRRGEVSEWLTSEAFDLREPRSLEAEGAIVEALSLARRNDVRRSDIDRVDRSLRETLSDTDRFWMRWTEFKKRQSNDSHGIPQ